MNIKSTIDYCLGLTYRELENFAGENYLKVYRYIDDNSRNDASEMLVATIFTCIASDGSLSDNEWKFISSFIGGYSYDQAYALAGQFNSPDAVMIVSELVRALPVDVRNAYISLCIAVLAVDNRVNGSEIEFLNTVV